MNSYSNMAQREHLAYQRFINLLLERGFTQDEARKIHRVYRDYKIITLDRGGGRYKLIHGLFLDDDILKKAVKENNHE